LCLLLALSATGGCLAEGQLEIILELPISGQGLNPMDDSRLDHFSLVVWGSGGSVETINNVPYKPGTRPFAIGRVPVGALGGLTLIGYSGVNQVLAYGQAGAFTTDETGSVTVNLALRKPFTYVAGGHQVFAFDNTRSDTDDTQSPLPATGGVTTDIASTPDGRYLLVSVADFSAVPTIQPAIKLFTTASHQPGKEIPLVFKPGHISLSPDGRWAVVSEYRPDDLSTPTEPADMVAIVDVPAALESPNPSQTVRTMSISNPGRVAFVRNQVGLDLAVVLTDALPPAFGCGDGAPSSSLSTIRLDTAQLVGTPVELGTPVRDITSDPLDYRVFLADTCNFQVLQFDAHSQVVAGAPWSFTQVTSQAKDLAPYSVIISGSRLWVGLMDDVGVDGQEQALLHLASVTGWTAPSRSIMNIMSLPFTSEAVEVLTDGGGGGARVLIDIQPYRVRLHRLSVPPGEGRVTALVRAEYYTDEINFTGTSFYLNPVGIVSESYLALDTGSAGIRRQFRIQCRALDYTDPVNPQEIDCQELAAHEFLIPEDSFTPRSVTSIYGVP
jgi:hypothetical protein